MAKKQLVVRFWGVRGSYPVPGQSTVRFGGNTPCVEVRAGRHVIVLDAGTGIIALGEKLIAETAKSPDPAQGIVATLFISHTHHDHIQGLPFFTPAYRGTSRLYIFGPRTFEEDLEDVLARAMLTPYFPVKLDEMNSLKVIRSLKGSETIVFPGQASEPQVYAAHQNSAIDSTDSVIVRVFRSYAHPKDGVFVFRIEAEGKSIVYATDTEGYAGGDSRLITFSKGADLLIHDTMYENSEYVDPTFPKQGFGHSTLEMAVEVAQKAGVKELVLFHHDPSHDDARIAAMEKSAQRLFPHTKAAYEGMELVV